MAGMSPLPGGRQPCELLYTCYLLTYLLTYLLADLYLAWCCSGQSVGLATQKVGGSMPAVTLLGDNFGQVIHTHVPLSPSSIIWYRSKGGDAQRRRTGYASQTSAVYPPTGSRPKEAR